MTTPVEVAFDSMTCAATLPGVGVDDDFENIDFVAAEGDQACLIELAVTNTGKKPNSFGSRNYATLRTMDGTEFSVTSQDYDEQGIALAKDREPSFTSDGIQPGKTKYDAIIIEIPEGATPADLVYNVATFDGT